MPDFPDDPQTPPDDDAVPPDEAPTLESLTAGTDAPVLPPERSVASLVFRFLVPPMALLTAVLSVWVIVRGGKVAPAHATHASTAAATPKADACAGLRWRPPEGAVEAQLEDGVEARFPMDLMTNCVLGVEAQTQVRIWFTKDGLACGIAVNAPDNRHEEVKACLTDRLQGARIPALASGDYATMDIAFQ